MVEVRYNPFCRTGNHLFLYVVGRLLARTLNLALKADPLDGFPGTKKRIDGKVIEAPVQVLRGTDPIPSWPDVEHLRGKRLVVGSNFVNSRYFVEDRERIKRWLAPTPMQMQMQMRDPDDLLVHVRLQDFLPGRYCPLGLVLDTTYYTTLLSRLKFKNLYVMTDHAGHPYHDCFAPWNPHYLPSRGLDHFFGALSFKRVIMSNSTFIWWCTFLSSSTEIYLPMLNGDRVGAWCVGHIPLGVDLRLDLPEVTHVYNIPNWGPSPSPCPPITDTQRVEAVAFSKRSKTLFLP